MLNKKIPSIEGVDALTFYAQRLSLIRDDLQNILMLWRSCTDVQPVEVLGHMIPSSCNKRSAEKPCKSCIKNQAISKEKKRLKAQFNKTVEKMLTFTPCEPKLCYKEKPTFTDIEINKIEGEK